VVKLGERDNSQLGWNTDDERDYDDQQYSPPSPMAYYSGSHNPLACFMAAYNIAYDIADDKIACDAVCDVVYDID
jgi:hypothetical protein